MYIHACELSFFVKFLGMKVTQKMVAEKAGVDRSTVSYVLSNGPIGEKISPNVVARIRRAARELDYTPNRLAQSLATGRTRTIALVVQGLTGAGHWIWGEAAEGAETALFEAGYDAHLCRFKNDHPLIAQAECLVREGRADAVIAMLWGSIEDNMPVALQLDFPLVFVNINYPPGPGRVSSDVTVGLRQAVDHLHDLGHEHILWVNPRFKKNDGSHDRELCVRERAHTFGMRADTINLSFTGREITDEFDRRLPHVLNDIRISLPHPLHATAVMCWNDFMAHAVCHVLRERGLRIPDDVSTTGLDHMQPSAHIPPLTTVSGAYRELGEAAARLAIDLSRRKEPAPPPAVTVPTYLVVRASTGKAKRI